jgi:eukaryotic-like serine/threonine-protein kinase
LVTLKAKASTGSVFAGWSGACAGRKSTCRLRVDDTLKVIAKFSLGNCVVPNVKGKSLLAAKHALKAHSCSAGKITYAFSSTVTAGHVISQKPQAGTHLRHNGKVNLTVSKG